MNKLSHENLFVPSQKNVRAILARYNLPLTRFLHATHGIENLTLLVWSQRKKYVLRVYPQKKKSDADILLVVCLGYTLWDVLFEKGGSPALMARYLQKYQEVRQLSQREKEVLPEIILFRHYVITTVRIPFGDFSQNDLDKALQQEQELRKLELMIFNKQDR